MNSLTDDEVKKRSLVCMYCWLDCTAYTDMSSVHLKIRKCIHIYNFYVERQSPMFVEVLEEKHRVAIRKAIFKLVENLLSDSQKSEKVAAVPKVAVDVDEHGKEKVSCFAKGKRRGHAGRPQGDRRGAAGGRRGENRGERKSEGARGGIRKQAKQAARQHIIQY